MIYDAFTYNGETDLLEIHLNVLDKYVDQFVILEANQTFSGRKKELLFERDKIRFSKFLSKIKYYVLDDWDNKAIWDMALESPNTIGASHWRQEFYIKEHLKDALTHLKDDDIVFIGDVDEIWDWNQFAGGAWNPIWKTLKLKLKVYTYWLNNRSSEQFAGTLVGNYKDIKGACLNHLRADHSPTYFDHGWHFTSMGGEEALKKKLTDSYTQDSYATPYVLEHLGDNMARNKDFLGRDFTYKVDESKWPQYLKDNRDKFKHLCK